MARTTQPAPAAPGAGSNMAVTKNLNTTVVALRNHPLSANVPTIGQALVFDGVNWSPTTISTGGGTPGGANTQVQFNDGGAFAGDAGLTYDKTTDILLVNGGMTLGQDKLVSAPVSLTLKSTNGTFGESILRITNEAGINGAMFETVPNSGANLVDFVFKTGGPSQSNIRYETRPAELTSGNSWEFQFGSPGNSQSQFRVGNAFVKTSIPIQLPANPTLALEAATKQYVDAKAPPNLDKVPIVFSFPGKPVVGVFSVGVSTVIPLHIPTNFAGSVYSAQVLPTAVTQFNAWTTIAGVTSSTGYIRVNPDRSITGLMTAVTLNIGDSLTFENPATQDATLSNISITVLTTRV